MPKKVISVRIFATYGAIDRESVRTLSSTVLPIRIPPASVKYCKAPFVTLPLCLKTSRLFMVKLTLALVILATMFASVTLVASSSELVSRNMTMNRT